MKRTFALLSAFAVIMIIMAGGSVYWLAISDIQNAKQQVTIALAKGVALGLASKIELLNQTLDKIGHEPSLLTAVESGEPKQLKQTLTQLQNLVPGAMKLRFLFPETNVFDQTEIPHLGYADIELVRKTFEKNQPPMIQGTQGPNRHLAIARRIKINDRVTAVLLASMKYDFLKKNVQAVGLKEGLIELVQDTLIMESSGSKPLKQNSKGDAITVAGTNWLIRYWIPEKEKLHHFNLITSSILVCSFFILLIFYIIFRKASELLLIDQTSVLQAIKDMMAGHVSGNYPVFLDEMKVVIATIQQYKRVMQHHEIETETPQESEELNLDELFNEVPENPDLEISSEQPEQSDQIATFNDADHGENIFLDSIIDEQPETDNTNGKPVSIPDTVSIQSTNFGIPEIPLGHIDSSNLIFRAYDIRGIAGKSLTKEIIYNIGKALGSEASEKSCKTMVLARDGRNSGPALCESLAQGILSTGLNVIDLGMVPTPVLYFVVHHHQDHTGVMLTGSHNPAEYNGIKMVINGETLAGEQIQNLRQRIENNDFVTEQQGELSDNNLFKNEYIGAISEHVHIARPMKVVVDCGNGVAGEIAPTLLKTLGCNVIELFCEIDGDFPNHHPDPSQPENLKDLEAAIKYYNADLGIAFDGDGDRLGVLDSKGKIIWPDRQMMLYAKDVLKSNPGAEIIYDVKCTNLLTEQISKYGGRPLMYKTGHSFMKAKLKETGAKLAGEMSGHIFFNDRWFGFDDALYAASRLIEILSSDSRDSHEVFAELPDSVNTPELNVTLNEGENFQLIEKLIQSANFADGKVATIDGLRIDFEDGWGLVRASNTTPSLVLRFDANSKDALNRIQDQFKTLLLQVKPDIKLPF